MEYSQALVERIDIRLTELKAEIDEAQRALRALKDLNARNSGKASAARNRQPPAEADGRRAPRRPRRRRVASAEAVFDALGDGNDQAAMIAKQFGVSTAMVRSRLQELEEAGRVSRTGERRGTRWRSHSA